MRVAAAGLALLVAAPAGAEARRRALADFLPANLGAAKRVDSGPELASGRADHAVAGYAFHADRGSPSAPRVFVNLNWIGNADEAHRAFGVPEPDDPRHRRIKVDGRPVNVMESPSGSFAEVETLLADRILVNVRLDAAHDGKRAIALLRKLDLKGMESFARRNHDKTTLRPVPAPADDEGFVDLTLRPAGSPDAAPPP